MKIIRWLLGHSLLILLIVVVIYGYMFWGNLAGEDTPAGKALAYLSNEFVEVEEFVNAVKAKQEHLSGKQTPNDHTYTVSADSVSDNSAPGISTGSVVDSADNNPVQSTNTEAVVASDGESPVKSSSTEAVVASGNENPVQSSNAEAVVASGNENPVQSASAEAVVDSANDNSVQSNSAEAIVGSANDIAAQSSSPDVINSRLEPQPTSSSDVKAGSAAAAGAAVVSAGSDEVMIASSEVKQKDNLPLTTSQEKSTVKEAQLAANAMTEVDTRGAFVSPEIEKQLSNVDSQGRVADKSQQDDAIRVTWITARKSFYQRNYALSEQSYQKVIDSTRDNFDAYGELGNVYFNQGKKALAASAYFEAAAILVRKGQIRRAQSLMGLLQHLDKSKADELQQLIDSTIS